MKKDLLIDEHLRKHFACIGVSVNQQEIANAAQCISELMLDEEIVIQVMIKHVYPASEFNVTFRRRKEDK